jgi:flagellar motility protein MotE (MotC chaperone)
VILRRSLPSIRLIDGVIIAAVALLGLKVLGFFADARVSAPPHSAIGSAVEQKPAAPSGQAGFGRVLSHARTNYEPVEPTTTGSLGTKAEDTPTPKQVPVPAADGTPPLVPPSTSERVLLERLGERREELHQRSREMEARERLMQEQEHRLEERLNQLKAAEESQKSAAAAKPAGSDPTALKNVVVMYETMKPKEAARVFDRLPIDVLLSVVVQMNARKMAEILAVMTPENAEKLTVALAKRANGPAENRPVPAAALPAGELPAIERPTASRR